MDWTNKCSTCQKSGALINQCYFFACFDDECNYTLIDIPEESATTSCSVWIEIPHDYTEND